MAWIFGCGRTGSTWLTEMLDDVPGLRSWNEPYFGRLFRHLHDRPDERKRPSAFFFGGFHRTWKEGIRRLFFDMVRQRFPEYGRSSLVVKEVNTPEFFPLLRSVFPASQYILLIRDPFDVLDSYIDMSKPGSWSKHFSSPAGGPDEKSIRRSAAHIHEALSTAFDSYLEYPESQRLMVRYEDLLEDPARWLTACARLVSLDVTSETAERIVEKHRFERHQETGELAFRRYGQTGIWQRSGNFNPAMTALAEEILGGLRKRLGYESPPERRAVDAQGMLDA